MVHSIYLLYVNDKNEGKKVAFLKNSAYLTSVAFR